MRRPIALVHGAWVTAASWDAFRRPFEAAGHAVHTPTWPLLEGLAADQIVARPPAGFGSLGIEMIAGHLARSIGALVPSPVLIGHSFGGLLVQMLLDRGLGCAGIAFNPVPIGGIVPGPTAIAAIAPIVLRPRGWARPYTFTRDRWARRFANAAPRSLADAAYDSYVIPAPGRIFYQAALGLGTWIDAARRSAPLLITGSDRDRLVTPYLSRAAWRLQRRSPAQTDYLDLPGRSHFLLAEPGWEQIAARALKWVEEAVHD